LITFSSLDGVEKIEIYDNSGRRVFAEEASKLTGNSIKLSSFTTGIHYVKVYFTSTEIRTIKILKQ
jgi:hypothetical protein